MNPFRNLPHPSKSFKPVKEMILQELVYLIVIAELSIALLKMFDPVETGILKFRGKMLLFLTSLNVGRKHIRNA
jgi:hypothetical protein